MIRKKLIKVLLILTATLCTNGLSHAQSASTLQNSYQQLQDKLKHNQFNRPIYLDSKQTSNAISGDIYSLVNYPYSVVQTALDTSTEWCEILSLHLNIKYCTPINSNKIEIYAGSKNPQPLSSAYKMIYNFKSVINNVNYMQIVISSPSGPLGTSNYHILMEAIPVKNKQTYIHIKYSYQFGIMAKLATNVYLDTVGSNKEGFTITGTNDEGKPVYVSGLRGAIERNTMRYYLAIEAYLKSLSAPPEQQREKRLKTWFKATQRYPQLYEITEQQYLSMKQQEYTQTPSSSDD